MPDTETKRLDSREISENSAGVLKGAASDIEMWSDWLATIAFHPNESANNCAAIMASPYEDTRELRNAAEWEQLGGTIKEGEVGIPLVHRSKSGNFFVDVQYPATAVDDAREHYRGLPVKIDLEDEVDGPAFAKAAEKWGAELDEASPNIAYVIYSRYGLGDGAGMLPVPELPDPEIIEDTKALASYCRDLKRDAENLIFKFDATINAERRNIMSPKVEVKQDAPSVVEDENVAETVERTPESVAEAVERTHDFPAPKPAFDASAHVDDPSAIYSQAATAAIVASGGQAVESPHRNI